MDNAARHRPHQHSVAACITASTMAHSSGRTDDSSCLLNIKSTTDDVIMPSWATQLVIVLINTDLQPALQQVPGRTHHTVLTIQAVFQNYVKQLTMLLRRHIWRHIVMRHTKHHRRDFSPHLKQQLVAPHWQSSLSVEHHSEIYIVYCSMKTVVCMYTNSVSIVPVT